MNTTTATAAGAQVQVWIRKFDNETDQYITSIEVWTLLNKLGRCSAPLVKSPLGFEIEVMPRSGKILLGRSEQRKLGFELFLGGQEAKVLNWTA